MSFGVLLLVAILWYYTLVAPLQAAIELERKSNDQLEQQIVQASDFQTMLPGILTAIADAQARLDRYYQSCATNHELIASLLSYLKGSKLSLLSCTLDREIDKQWFIESTVECTFEGAFSNIFSFFQNLTTNQRLIITSQWTISKAEDNKVVSCAAFHLLHVKKDRVNHA